MSFKKLYVIVVCAAGIATISACIAFLFASYESIIRLIIAISKKPYLETLLRTQVFSISKYVLVRYICMAMLLVIPVCTMLLFRYQQNIMHFSHFVFSSVQEVYKKVKQVYLQNSKAQNATIAILL